MKTVFERAIPNIPDRSLIALEVSYAPGGKSLSHIHAKSAFIYAHVLSGAIRSQVNDEPAQVYQAAEAAAITLSVVAGRTCCHCAYSTFAA